MDTKKNNKLIMYIMIAVLFAFVVTGLYPVTAKADEIGTSQQDRRADRKI